FSSRRRHTRCYRDWSSDVCSSDLKLGALATAGLATPGALAETKKEKKEPVRIGSGQWTYTLDEDWGKLPEGMKYGFGCGIVVDSKDRVYVTSRSVSPCEAVFERKGKIL